MTNVEKVREFNRFYMPYMNLLGNHYLGSEYSVPEARVLFEIYCREGCNATYITRQMNLDKGYLSRILKKHEKRGYIHREQSVADGRSYALFLTNAGRRRTEDFIRKSNAEIETILRPLSSENQRELVEALNTVMRVLSPEVES